MHTIDSPGELWVVECGCTAEFIVAVIYKIYMYISFTATYCNGIWLYIERSGYTILQRDQAIGYILKADDAFNRELDPVIIRYNMARNSTCTFKMLGT